MGVWIYMWVLLQAGCTVLYMKGMYVSRILCSGNLYWSSDWVPITLWFTSLIDIWWRGGEGETMHLCAYGCGCVICKDCEMVCICLMWSTSSVLWKPCHTWLDIFMLNLIFMVQSIIAGGGRTWELGDCMVTECILWHPFKGKRTILLVGLTHCYFNCSMFATSIL
jgi:hypothetical protein